LICFSGVHWRRAKKTKNALAPFQAVFGLDAFASAAYGPEAALTVLIPLSVVGVSFAKV